eukprot:symbB.v1.2.038862.t1/scaffold6212.1/size31780/1
MRWTIGSSWNARKSCASTLQQVRPEAFPVCLFLVVNLDHGNKAARPETPFGTGLSIVPPSGPIWEAPWYLEKDVTALRLDSVEHTPFPASLGNEKNPAQLSRQWPARRPAVCLPPAPVPRAPVLRRERPAAQWAQPTWCEHGKWVQQVPLCWVQTLVAGQHP